MLKRGFPAIADLETRLFILGSLPGDKSLEEGRYYAHHSNQFWKLVGALAGEDLQSLDYSDRLLRLKARGIGLWDVFSAAERDGSADSAIKGAEHNPIGGLKTQYPLLEAIAFNGGKAAKAGRRLLGDMDGIRLYDLVSSSGLAGIALADKIERWRVVSKHFR